MKNAVSCIITCLLLLTALVSCEEDDSQQIPAYLYIPQVNLQTHYPTEGSADDRAIYDVWVEANERLIGAFELPALIPVLHTGPTKIELRGGVFENGMSDARNRYPYFTIFETQADLTPGDTHVIIPTVGYSDRTDFMWMEKFSNPDHITLQPFNNNNVDIEVTTNEDEVFEGEGSLKVVFEEYYDIMELISDEVYTFSALGDNRLFLEIHFRTTVDVEIGIESEQNLYNHVMLTTDDSWRKIYINLTNQVAERTRDGQFRVFFAAFNNTDEQQTFYLDNIKLLRFE